MIVIQLFACVGTILGFGAALASFGGMAAEALRSAVPALPPPAPKPGPRRIRVSPARALSAHCPVCANALKGEVVMCPRCQALSHEDCWSYQGGCAIFACEARA